MKPLNSRTSSHGLAWLILASVAIFSLTFGLTAYRLSQAPDIFTDEIIYTRMGGRVAGEGALVWDSGAPFVVHPPLYFVAEGLYFNLIGHSALPLYAPGDIFTAVFQARYLNAFFAGLTALVLFLLGRRLRGNWLGVLLVALFVLDPFALRINRRAMLETLAELLVLLGMLLLISDPDDQPISVPRAVSAGLVLGAALLTKEIQFPFIFALILFGLWEAWLQRRSWRSWQSWQSWVQGQPRPVLAADGLVRLSWVRTLLIVGLTLIIALATYSLYPLWIAFSGAWVHFYNEKLLGLARLLGFVQLTGWNRPGVSLAQFLLGRLTDYGSSYLLLALGGMATAYLFFFGRPNRAGRLMVSWGLVLYPFFAFLALRGSGNDQFFYFLLVTAIILFGYGTVVFIARLAEASRRMGIAAGVVMAAVMLFILPFNAYKWASNYAIEQDNAYSQLEAYVVQNVPTNAPLNATGDPIKFRYFFPGRTITGAGTPSEAETQKVHYFFLAPKDIANHYGSVQPSLAAWITSQGHLLAQASGDSYGTVYLYRVDYTPAKPNAPVPPVRIDQTGKSFHPGQANFISLLVWMGLGWSLSMASLSYALSSAERHRQVWTPHQENADGD